jgi:hypothetical protein
VLVPAISLAVSLLILVISFYTLYLSHLKEHRSKVELLLQDSGPEQSVYDGGPHVNRGVPHWSTRVLLKITNTGEKGAYISSYSHDVISLRKGDKTTNDIEVLIETRSTPQLNPGNKIDSGETIRYNPTLKISSENDVRRFLNHESVIIRHTIVVEDNKGSYEAWYESDMELQDREEAIEQLGIEQS